MAVGEDIVKSIEEKGSSPELVVEFLRSYIKLLKKSEQNTSLILTLNKIESAYSDMYDYYQPTKSVLVNFNKRLKKIIPLLEQVSATSSEQDRKSIEAIVANQKLLNVYSSEKSKWENFKDKFSNKFRSPLEEPEG